MAYSVEDKKLIKKLKAAGVELTGEESSEELQTKDQAQSLEEKEDSGEAEEVEGIPNNLPIRTTPVKIGNADVKLAIFFVATVKGGKQALYDYEGRRVSPAFGAEDTIAGSVTTSTPNGTKGINHINRACAKFNAQRMKNVLSPRDL